MATNTYVALDETTLGTAVPSITFSSIPQGYTDLVVVMSPATTHTLATFTYMRFNGDSGSNYSYTEVNGNGTSATSFRDTNQTIGWTSPQMASISNTLGDNTTIVNVMNYSNSTTNKTYLSRANRAGSTLDYQGVEAAVGLWRNTAAITSILIGNRRGGVDYNFSVGSTFSLYGIAAEGTTPAPLATGGAIYSDADYYYHVFGSTGVFTPASSLTADVLVVAGGGGAGSRGGGGGGAGGLLAFTSQSLSATNYTCTVGAGGAGGGGTSTGGIGSTGGDSQFGGLTLVKGGGWGIRWLSAQNVGAAGTGGSGGGATATDNGTVSLAGSNTSGQGFNGGGSGAGAGGGGGAGATGGVSSSTVNGAGGIGATSLFINAIGSATGTGQTVSGTTYFAGGGGGAWSSGPMATAGAGGLGGGGTGTQLSGQGIAGLANTGGGGGGAANNSDSSSVYGGNGGSGIVIVRYLKA
jgi:hypothetical protein